MTTKNFVHRPRLVIAGTASDVGKTTVTLGIMAAFTQMGLSVQGFKVGPDYIDPGYHTVVTGRTSRNLDTWMMTASQMREVFLRNSESADLSIIEGVMGLYDGKEPTSNEGTTAEIAIILDAPVVLVLDVSSMARSAAAIVLGFMQMEPKLRLAGVLVNKVGSVGHYHLVKAAIEQVCAIPVLGYLLRDDGLHLEDRHLGLIPAFERPSMMAQIDILVHRMNESVACDALLTLAKQAPAMTISLDSCRKVEAKDWTCTIAVAKDVAFHFYYEENLEWLTHFGAKLVFFSPLANEPVPKEADGIYLGGGFPEVFASKLSANERTKQSLRETIENKIPTYAECGGYMYLFDAIVDQEGQAHPMVGVLHGKVTMQKQLAALGYREVMAREDSMLMNKGEIARGHEFHYSRVTLDNVIAWPFAYEAKGWRGEQQEGYAKDNLIASYIHLHFSSNPTIAARFVASCLCYRDKKSVNPL